MGRFWNGWWIGKLVWLGLVGVGLWLLASWLQMPIAPSLDTLIGIVTLLWLFFIVTVPWNMYFQAHQLLFEADVSERRGLRIDPEARAYAQRWSRIALGIALGLHALTALAFCGVALSGMGFMGWFGAMASVVLTLLRPGVRAYVHVRDRLGRLSREIEVPREDAVELRRRLSEVEKQLTALTEQHRDLADNTAQHLHTLDQRATDNNDRHTDLAEHVRLELVRVEREAKNTIAQVLGDAAVVGHVRELVRFFKQA
ncbi:MAG: hypothetical protein V4858_02075 [Pseudomonadota bacterium]